MLYILLVFTPITVGLEFIRADHVVIFVFASIALIPLAKLIGDSTGHLSLHYGPTLGSLLNVTLEMQQKLLLQLLL